MDYRTIYRDHAEEYDRLIRAEDCDGNLLPALEAIRGVTGATVVDVGTGTGRLARLLVGRARHVIGVEPSAAMLAIARRHLESGFGQRALALLATWELHQGSADALPVASDSADVVVAGWVLGHLRHWRQDDWKTAIGEALVEMNRCLRPDGVTVLVETLGTGREEPRAPNAELDEYFTWLESQGFVRRSLRTDYAFPDVATAAQVCGFFFGEDFARRVVENGWARVPECTGIWSRGRLARSTST